MKRAWFLILMAACKAPADPREAQYNRLLKIAGEYHAAAERYGRDVTPSGTKHFNDAVDSVELYLDSASKFAPGGNRSAIDSMLKVDHGADKRYNDSLNAGMKATLR